MPKAPDHLEEATRQWWEQIAQEFELQSYHLRILTLAGEQWDRAQAAREIIASEGIT